MATKIPKITLILFIAFLLRFWNISRIPSLNPDEAALGYNAYSLLETGKDEHGIAWPLHFKSFGDYKPGGYVYLAMPFVKILGLTPFAVRFPNLIFSLLTIYVLYHLVLLLTNNYLLSNLTAIVLAVNPWHLQFSRGAWESSTALFFIVLGIYFFYKFIVAPKSIYRYLFLLPFIASLYIYHSARLISPLIVFVLFLLNFKLLISLSKTLILPCLLALILTIPVFISFLNSGGTTRLGGVGLMADKGPLSRSEELLNHHNNVKLINRAMHNRRVLYALSWLEKYTSHFNLNFLFLNGDEVPRSKNPEMGQLYLIELPFLLIGIFVLLKHQSSKALKYLVISLLLISPLASSLTFQAPSALRALPMVIPLSILIALGLNYFILWLLKIKAWKFFVSWLLFLGYCFSIFYYLDSYYNHAPSRYSFAWNRGFSEIIPLIESEKNNYQNIYLTNKYDQPYILYLFYAKYDPSKIQSQIKLTPVDQFGFSTVEKIDNITFKIPSQIPPGSLVIDASDFQLSGESFKIYNK